MEQLIWQFLSSVWAALAPGLLLLPVAFGAYTITPVRRTADELVLDVLKGADGDTVTGNIAHGMGVIPNVTFTPTVSLALAALPGFALTTLNATNIEFTGLATVGSATANIRVYVTRPR